MEKQALLGSRYLSVNIKHHDTVLLTVAGLEKNVKIIREEFHCTVFFNLGLVTKNKDWEESLDKNGISVNKKT